MLIRTRHNRGEIACAGGILLSTYLWTALGEGSPPFGSSWRTCIPSGRMKLPQAQRAYENTGIDTSFLNPKITMIGRCRYAGFTISTIIIIIIIIIIHKHRSSRTSHPFRGPRATFTAPWRCARAAARGSRFGQKRIAEGVGPTQPQRLVGDGWVETR